MEEQKMDVCSNLPGFVMFVYLLIIGQFHDDGESGLGAIVASISLGGPARMKFRLKARHENNELEDSTLPPPSKRVRSSLPSNLVEEEDPQDEIETGAQDANVPVDMNNTTNGDKVDKRSRIKLDLMLNHGDVVVMKGRDIQHLWEHSAQPTGLFRIAATARFIDQTHGGQENAKLIKEASTEELLSTSPQMALQNTVNHPLASPILSDDTAARIRNRQLSLPTGMLMSGSKQASRVLPDALHKQQDISHRRHSVHVPSVQNYVRAHGYTAADQPNQPPISRPFGHSIPDIDDLYSPIGYQRFQESFERETVEARLSRESSLARTQHAEVVNINDVDPDWQSHSSRQNTPIVRLPPINSAQYECVLHGGAATLPHLDEGMNLGGATNPPVYTNPFK